MSYKQFVGNLPNEVVIAFDTKKDHKYWRHNIHPHYKGNRKRIPDVGIEKMFETLKTLEEDIKTYFPWKIVRTDYAEGDDVIFALTKRFAANTVLIIASDKDYLQLQKFTNVYQYDPMKRVFLEEPDPFKFKFEHIVKGDGADGVPNIFSPIDAIEKNIRQTPVRATKLNELFYILKDHGEVALQTVLKDSYQRYLQNSLLIDSDKIPTEIESAINSSYDSALSIGNEGTFWKWCSQNGMRTLMEKSNQL